MKKKLKLRLNLIIAFIFKLLPLNNKMVYFASFHGQYTDNPKYISEKLYNLDNSFKYVWEINEKSKEKNLPRYIKQVKPHSFKSIFYRSRSNVVVENYAGWLYGFIYEDDNKLFTYIKKHMKKKNQLNISTWHGTMYKRIADETIKSKKGKDFHSTSDYLLAGCDYTRDILDRVFMHKIPVVMSGTPRNDILFLNDQILKRRLLEKMELPLNKKIVLYAPTFRDKIEYSGIKQMTEIDFDKLLKSFNEKFGGEWIFVFRAHDSVVTNNEVKKIKDKYANIIYDGNKSDDMAEYLYVSDVMITDYSGCFFDYALTKRPCFLYCPDIQEYSTKERGFYFPIDELPYSMSETPEGLVSSVNTFEDRVYQSKITNFLLKIGNKETGSATDNVCEKIIQFLKNK